MKLAVASLSLMMVACNASDAPAKPAPDAPPAPAATSEDRPMAKRAPGQPDTMPLQVFRAFGTEPFWNVNVEDATLTYTTPEDPAGVVMQGVREPQADGVEITGTHAGRPFALRVAAGECSDGMSDHRYTMTATFKLGDIAYTGCGESAK